MKITEEMGKKIALLQKSATNFERVIYCKSIQYMWSSYWAV